MPSVRVNDIELYYEVQGDGSPLLLVPGLGVDIRFFRGIIDDLSASCRVVAFDPRGAGRSGKPDVPYSIDGMAGDAAALLDHLDIDTDDRARLLDGRPHGADAGARPSRPRRSPRPCGHLRVRATGPAVQPALADHGRARADPGSEEHRPPTALRLAASARASVGFDVTPRLGESTSRRWSCTERRTTSCRSRSARRWPVVFRVRVWSPCRAVTGRSSPTHADRLVEEVRSFMEAGRS